MRKSIKRQEEPYRQPTCSQARRGNSSTREHKGALQHYKEAQRRGRKHTDNSRGAAKEMGEVLQ